MARTQPPQFRSAARNAKGVQVVLTRLARRMRNQRKLLKLTQEQAAERMGFDAKHLQLIEAGRTNPTVATLVAIAKGLGVGIDKLFRR